MFFNPNIKIGAINCAAINLELKRSDICEEGMEFVLNEETVVYRSGYKQNKPEKDEEMKLSFEEQEKALIENKRIPEWSEKTKKEVEEMEKIRRNKEEREKRNQKELNREFNKRVATYHKIAVITHKPTGANLHSHPQKFDTGHQQVSCLIATNDDNDDWFFYPPSGVDLEGPVTSGDQVRLFHRLTKHFLQSLKDVKSPVSNQQEVSAVENGFYFIFFFLFLFFIFYFLF